MPFPIPPTWGPGPVEVTNARLNTMGSGLTWLKAALDLITDATAADTGTGTYLSITRPLAVGSVFARGLIAGDTEPRVALLYGDEPATGFSQPGGQVAFGPGTAALDTYFTRLGVGSVELSSPSASVALGGAVFSVANSSILTTNIRVVKADTFVTLVGLGTNATGQGRVAFGDGIAAADSFLTRDQAYRLLFSGYDSGGTIQPARVGVVQGAAAASVSYSLFAWADGDTFPRAALGRGADGLPALFFGGGGAIAPLRMLYGDSNHLRSDVLGRFDTQGVATRTTSSKPVDADFVDVTNGIIAFNSGDEALWGRFTGGWKGTLLAASTSGMVPITAQAVTVAAIGVGVRSGDLYRGYGAALQADDPAFVVPTGKTLKILSATVHARAGATAGTYTVEAQLKNTAGGGSYQGLVSAAGTANADIDGTAFGTPKTPLASLAAGTRWNIVVINAATSPAALGANAHLVQIVYIYE